MPAHQFAVARHLAEIVRAPPDHVLAQQVFDDGDDARMREQVVNLRVFQMRRADRIAVASGGDDSFEQTVEVTPMRGDLVSIEDADGLEKTVAVERGDLLPRKRQRIFDAEPVKTQVSLDLIEIIVVGNDFELGWLSHRSLPNISFRRPLSPCPP